jgi:hypothetical protein
VVFFVAVSLSESEEHADSNAGSATAAPVPARPFRKVRRPSGAERWGVVICPPSSVTERPRRSVSVHRFIAVKTACQDFIARLFPADSKLLSRMTGHMDPGYGRSTADDW